MRHRTGFTHRRCESASNPFTLSGGSVFFATTVKNDRSLSVVEKHTNTTGSALVARANKSAVGNGAPCGSEAATRRTAGICRTQDAFSKERVRKKAKLPIKAIFLKCALALFSTGWL